MGKKKTTQQNSYSYQTPPNTPDINAYRDWKPQIDPGISYMIGNAKNRLKDTVNNPQGAYTTPAIRDAVQRTGNENLTQLEGQLFREGTSDVNRQEGAKRAGVAGLTAPQLVQSGGSTSSTSGGALNAIIGGGAHLASALI